MRRGTPIQSNEQRFDIFHKSIQHEEKKIRVGDVPLQANKDDKLD